MDSSLLTFIEYSIVCRFAFCSSLPFPLIHGSSNMLYTCSCTFHVSVSSILFAHIQRIVRRCGTLIVWFVILVVNDKGLHSQCRVMIVVVTAVPGLCIQVWPAESAWHPSGWATNEYLKQLWKKASEKVNRPVSSNVWCDRHLNLQLQVTANAEMHVLYICYKGRNLAAHHRRRRDFSRAMANQQHCHLTVDRNGLRASCEVMKTLRSSHRAIIVRTNLAWKPAQNMRDSDERSVSRR